MHVEMRIVNNIKPYANNPRVNDPAVDAVADSIRRFGFRQPIVVDEEGVIIVGHTRYKAALKLGLTEVPIHIAIGLSPAKPKRIGSPTIKRQRCRIGMKSDWCWS